MVNTTATTDKRSVPMGRVGGEKKRVKAPPTEEELKKRQERHRQLLDEQIKERKEKKEEKERSKLAMGAYVPPKLVKKAIEGIVAQKKEIEEEINQNTIQLNKNYSEPSKYINVTKCDHVYFLDQLLDNSCLVSCRKCSAAQTMSIFEWTRYVNKNRKEI